MLGVFTFHVPLYWRKYRKISLYRRNVRVLKLVNAMSEQIFL